jgi:hypothetical protein
MSHHQINHYHRHRSHLSSPPPPLSTPFNTNTKKIDVDMGANFSYLAQRGLSWGFGMCEKLHLALAFLIEVMTD